MDRRVENFNELRKRYAKIGLDITQDSYDNYTVKKDGKLLFKGKAYYGSNKPTALGETLGDFMFNYKFTRDEYAEIHRGRLVSSIAIEANVKMDNRINRTMYGGTFVDNIAVKLDFGTPRDDGYGTYIEVGEKGGWGQKTHNDEFEEGFYEFMEEWRGGLSDQEWLDTYGFSRMSLRALLMT